VITVVIIMYIFCGCLGFGDFDDGPGSWGFNSSWGGSGGPGLRGNLGSRSGGLNMNMNSGGFGGLGMSRSGRHGGGGGNWTSNGTGLGGGGGHCIHMRGLPFRATQADIADVRLFEIPVFLVC
jgi:Predicted membrane protein